MRADMISSRRLHPAGVSRQQISFVVDEARPLVNLMSPVTTRGSIHGVIPGCHAAPPPSPPQPALVIRDDLSKSHPAVELAKAIRAHVEAMSKAETMYDGGSPPVDVSSPHHEHARLVAKKNYLEEKLDAHQRAMHPADHPDVAHRTKVLGQVNQKLSNLESRGIKSDLSHHEDWIEHYGKLHQTDPNKSKKMNPEEINTALHAHMGALASPRAHSMRRDVAGTQAGGHGLDIHPGVPGQEAQSMKPRPPMHEMLRQLKEQETYKGLFLIIDLSKAGAPHSPEDWDRVAGKANKQGCSLSFDVEAHRQKLPGRSPYRLNNRRFEKLEHAELALDSMAEKDKAARSRIRQEVNKAKSDDWISEKIRLLMHEGKPQKQAIAIAYSMAGRSKDKTEKSGPYRSPASSGDDHFKIARTHLAEHKRLVNLHPPISSGEHNPLELRAVRAHKQAYDAHMNAGMKPSPEASESAHKLTKVANEASDKFNAHPSQSFTKQEEKWFKSVRLFVTQ